MESSLNRETSELAEFSDRFSPVFVKELRQGLRANYFVMPFIGAQVLAIIAVILEMVLGMFGSGGLFSGGLFFTFLSIVFSIVMPLTLFGALQPEISAGRNVELLLMSNLTRWQIVRGKFLVGCVLSGLMMVSLLPYLLIRYFVGDVELLQNAGMVIALMLGNALMNAIVVGASATRNYVGRVFIIGFTVICYGFVSLAIGIAASTGSGTFGVLFVLAGTSFLYIVLSLQLGRAKLRVFENPLDPPSTALIIVLIVLSPVAVGMTMGMFAMLGGFWSMAGGVAAIVGLTILALLLDRGPGKKKPIGWAQP